MREKQSLTRKGVVADLEAWIAQRNHRYGDFFTVTFHSSAVLIWDWGREKKKGK